MNKRKRKTVSKENVVYKLGVTKEKRIKYTEMEEQMKTNRI